jgi:hypothetical protein
MKIPPYLVLILLLCLSLDYPSPALALETTEMYVGDILSITANRIVLDCEGQQRSFDLTPQTIICIDGYLGDSWEDLATTRTVTVSADIKTKTAARIDNGAVVSDMGGIQFQPDLAECQPRATTVEIKGEIIQVLTIQQLLVKAGIDTGPLDGKLGPLTARAIRQFETSRGLPETGKITPQLLAQLQAATATTP